jgi:isoamylase
VQEKTIHIGVGVPEPLGASSHEEGINFALYSPANKATLSIFPLEKGRPLLSFKLDQKIHKTNGVWHVMVDGLPREFDYSWKIHGHPACDPYAKAIATPATWTKVRHVGGRFSKARYLIPSSFDWQSIKKPGLPFEDLIIYEMHVRGFTKDTSSQCQYPGTYLGIVEKIPYLLELGVNAIELLPVYEFDETGYKMTDPETQKRLCDYWGYNPMHFFCPMKRYCAGKDSHSFSTEFKTMVRELHRNGIEVILDVVYNHTGEGNVYGPVTSWKAIDSRGYYLHDANGALSNYSGTGNTFACNREPGLSLILDSMRYFVREFQIDGFRFDLASIFTRGDIGGPLDFPPLLKEMERDPLLNEVKLIAEPWDAGGLYQVGQFPRWGDFSEWNGRYRDVVRRFIKGTDGEAGAFATAICGSQDMYGPYSRQSSHSINFVTCHDGFSLYDLVTYQAKRNERNGEDNRDGSSNNDNWNCGIEGPTDDERIIALRERQMRNSFLALLVSKGVPMLLMGDEYAQSHEGNNNPFCQDNSVNWFNWKQLENQKNSLCRFVSKLIRFRKNYSAIKAQAFLKQEEITWHGDYKETPDWGEQSRLVAFTRLLDEKTELFVAFHPHFEEKMIYIPSSTTNVPWRLLIDTSMPSPKDFSDPPVNLDNAESYTLQPYSAIVLIAGDLLS